MTSALDAAPTFRSALDPSALPEAAIAYARLGWAVFPLYEPIETASAEHPYGICSCPRGACCGRDCGKHPRTAHGKNDATTDEATIRDWWTRWPNANVALAMPAPFFVVDLDPRHGGHEAWAALCAEHEPLPTTPYARTGGGGFHGLYRRPEGIKLRAKLAPGVDIPTTHIAAPPSLHYSGAKYEWVRSPFDHEIAEPPGWLVELVRADGARARAIPQLPTASAEMHAPGRGDDPSTEAWNVAVRLMLDGGAETEAASALRSMASYKRRLRERGESEAERWLDLTIRRARGSNAVIGTWAGSIRAIVVEARYRYEGPKTWAGKPDELHRVRLRLAREDGELLEPRRYVTLPLNGRHEDARKVFDATIGDLGAPEAWLTGERPRLEAALAGRRLEIVMPAGPMRRAP